MEKFKIFQLILIIAASTFSINLYGKGLANPYQYMVEYQVRSILPSNASMRFLIISNREFHPEENYTYERGVSSNGQRFFFIVSRTDDSTYITPYTSIESALSVISNDKSFLIFVNGHGKNFEQSITRGFELGERYHVNMIMFDWPTEYYALRKTAGNARKVTQNFALTVNELNETFTKHQMNSDISVIFHSMGNHIARNLVKNGLHKFLPESFFQNLILNAAAVKQRNHSKWISEFDFQHRIYIVSNRNDFPLKGVKLLRLATPLGTEYKEPIVDKAHYIDFSEIAKREHNIFLGKTQVEANHPNVYDFYYSLFNGNEIDLTVSNEFAEIENGKGYFIL